MVSFTLCCFLTAIGVLSQKIAATPVASHKCPNGYEYRKDRTCCLPKKCGVGMGYRFCNNTSVSPGEDSCYRCPSDRPASPGINTGEETSQYPWIDICKELDCTCPKESELVNEEECKKRGTEKQCHCRREMGYFGQDGLNCDMVTAEMLRLIQQPGYELKQSGKVEMCESGTYKPVGDNSTCKPHSKCPPNTVIADKGSGMKDVTCKQVPSLSSSSTHKSTSAEYNPPKHDHSDGETDSSKQSTTGIIISIVVLTAVPVFIVIPVVIYFKRKKTSPSNNEDKSRANGCPSVHDASADNCNEDTNTKTPDTQATDNSTNNSQQAQETDRLLGNASNDLNNGMTPSVKDHCQNSLNVKFHEDPMSSTSDNTKTIRQPKVKAQNVHNTNESGNISSNSRTNPYLGDLTEKTSCSKQCLPLAENSTNNHAQKSYDHCNHVSVYIHASCACMHKNKDKCQTTHSYARPCTCNLEGKSSAQIKSKSGKGKLDRRNPSKAVYPYYRYSQDSTNISSSEAEVQESLIQHISGFPSEQDQTVPASGSYSQSQQQPQGASNNDNLQDMGVNVREGEEQEVQRSTGSSQQQNGETMARGNAELPGINVENIPNAQQGEVNHNNGPTLAGIETSGTQNPQSSSIGLNSNVPPLTFSSGEIIAGVNPIGDVAHDQQAQQLDGATSTQAVRNGATTPPQSQGTSVQLQINGTARLGGSSDSNNQTRRDVAENTTGRSESIGLNPDVPALVFSSDATSGGE